MAIEVVEVTPDRDDLVEAWRDIERETVMWLNPDDPPVTVEELRMSLAVRTTHLSSRAWIAFVDGEPAGEASFDVEHDDENRHIASSDWVAVRRAHQRRGVADALLSEALTSLADDGRTSLMLWAPNLDGGPVAGSGAAYASRLGLRPALEERCSRVSVTDIDDALIDGWLTTGRDRSDGYRVVQFSDRCPDEHLDAYIVATSAMDDMPTDDLDWTVAAVDEELVRSREEKWKGQGRICARTLALAPDGSAAGFSELFVNGHRPVLADQGDTGVVADHRGRGLGRWLKAENYRYAQRLSPTFEVIETYNAQSNPWMLDINVAMGFRPHLYWQAFQGDLAHALATTKPRSGQHIRP